MHQFSTSIAGFTLVFVYGVLWNFLPALFVPPGVEGLAAAYAQDGMRGHTEPIAFGIAAAVFLPLLHWSVGASPIASASKAQEGA